METPYNRRDPWRIDLRRTRGTIFMDVVKLPEQVCEMLEQLPE